MIDTQTFLEELISLPGLSAYESPIARVIRERWQSLTDEVHVSRVGSVEALKRGQMESSRPVIMVATHMDGIGLMVSDIAEVFLRVTAVGGVDARILPGQQVLVHVADGDALPGIVVQPPARLLPTMASGDPLPINYLLVDVGLSAREVSRRVQVGDVVSFATEPVKMAGGILAGHSLDNRASVAALTHALDILQTRRHAWDLWAVATVQEEVTLLGAATSAFGLRPDLAMAVDVTFAEGPGAKDWRTFPLKGGPVLAMGPNIHPFLLKKLQETADALEMSYAVEMMPGMSGTDAIALQIAAEGIPTAVLGMPLRYMHTPVEMVSIQSVERVGRLLAEWITRLTPDFLDSITWDE
ncbi:MAG: M42 family metallopeptidase [Anaerolineales bacterium]